MLEVENSLGFVGWLQRHLAARKVWLLPPCAHMNMHKRASRHLRSTVTQYAFHKTAHLRAGLEMVVKTVREASCGAQVPGFCDDGLIGPEFKMMA